MLLKELTDYRKKIMQLLCSDREIVDLVTGDPHSLVPNRDLMYKQIFPYAYTPDTQKEAKTFICFRLGVPEVMNKTYKVIEITFYVFTHQSLVRTSNGLRADLIGAAIERLFNGSLDFGLGRLALDGMDDIMPTTDYHGIALQYHVDEFNRPSIRGDKRRGEF